MAETTLFCVFSLETISSAPWVRKSLGSIRTEAAFLFAQGPRQPGNPLGRAFATSPLFRCVFEARGKIKMSGKGQIHALIYEFA